MDTIKKNRIEIMKKIYTIMSLKEEISENLAKIYEELEKELDNGTSLVKSNEWVELGMLSKNILEIEFIKNEMLINNFNDFIKKIEN